MREFDLNWLENPRVYEVNRLNYHSDHKYFKNYEEEHKQQTSMKQLLNGSWKFNYSNNLDLIPNEFYKEDYNVEGWDHIKVPGHIQLQGYDKPHYVNTMYPWDGHEKIAPPNLPKKYNPVGCYVRDFEVDKGWANRPVIISFQGVESAFYLWVNGEFIGYSEDSFTPAEFDITEYIKEGKNKLAVMVVKYSTGSWLEDQDFWRFSGIFRDVYLYTVPNIHIRDLFIKTPLKNNYKDSDLNITMDIEGEITGTLNVKLCEKNNEANEVVNKSIKLEDTVSDKKLNLNYELKNVKLWSAEEPNLYKLTLEIKNSSGEIVEVVTENVGFREFKMIDKIMHINGKRIVFKGVNRHEFSAHNGRYVSKEEMLWDVKTIKQNNMNSVRTSHYPNHSYFYELCDEYGLYVIDEANLETHGTWQNIEFSGEENILPNGKDEWLDAVLDRAKAMLHRDKNHPSIIIWSCGNESYGGENIFKMSETFRKLDDTRLVHYEGVFLDRRFDDSSDMESRMYALVPDIEKYLNENPQKPFILCEYSHAMGNSNGALHKYTDLEDKYPMYQGGFIWDFIDQGILATDRYGKEYIAFGGDFSDKPTDYNFCTNGIVYANRKLSPKVQEVKYNYQNFKIEVKRNTVNIKNNNLFIDTTDFDIKISLLREGKLESEYTLKEIIKAGEEKTINIDFEKYINNGEYAVNVSLVLNKDTMWANKGHEVAYGQHVFSIEETKEKQLLKVNAEDCVNNLGVWGDDFHIIFSKPYAGMISYKHRGKELIDTMPKPNFWRAVTDNDNGCKLNFKSAMWKGASLYHKVVDTIVNIEKYKAEITYVYELATVPTTNCELKYTTFGDGSVDVELTYKGNDNLPSMPEFGLIFKMPKEYDNFKFYGYGPDENYQDRNKGARLGIYNINVDENLSQYLIPQECGNRTQIRWAKILDNTNSGIKISGDSLEMSALPYTPHEIDNAYHSYELPPIYHTVIKVSKKQCGVGGDDSWISEPHEEYKLNSKEDMVFCFNIKAV